LEIIDEDEGVDVSEDGQTAQVGEVPCQMEACQICFAYLVNLEELQI